MACFSRNVIGHGVEEEDQKHAWMEDAEAVSLTLVLATSFPLICLFLRVCQSVILAISEAEHSVGFESITNVTEC